MSLLGYIRQSPLPCKQSLFFDGLEAIYHTIQVHMQGWLPASTHEGTETPVQQPLMN